jgi:hypothetical protein
MNPPLRTLAWKEWREQRRYLLVFAAWIVCGVIYLFVYEKWHQVRTPVGGFYSTCMLFSMFATIFLAMRVSLGEYSQRTLGFSAALPVGRAPTAAMRLGAAVVTLTGPILLGAFVLAVPLLTGMVEQVPERMHAGREYLPVPQRTSLPAVEATALLAKVTAVIVGQTLTLLVLLSVLGTYLRTEAQAGFWGVVVVLSSLPAGEFVRTSFKNPEASIGVVLAGAVLPQSLVALYGSATEAGVRYSDLNFVRRVWASLAANLFVLAGLALYFSRRYGRRIGESGKQSETVRRRWPALPVRVPVCLPGRIGALAWLDLRQAVPLALSGLAVACLITAIQLPLSESFDGDVSRGVYALAANLPNSTWIVAILWACVVGTGIYAAELQPRLREFWQSRPIHMASWFWVKFLVGLAAVVGILDGVTIAASWGTNHPEATNRMSWSYVACMPLFHAAMYAWAVLWVCGLRRAVPAGIAALLTFFVVAMAVESIPGLQKMDPLAVYSQLYATEYGLAYSVDPQRGEIARFDLTGSGYFLVYGTMAAAAIAMAVGASWLAAARRE